MKLAEHANLLSIFYWVFAGLQFLMFLLILLVVVLMGGMSIFAIVEGSPGSTEASVMFGLITAVYLFLLLLGAVSIVMNIVAGKSMRGEQPVKPGFIRAASILNFASFLCGGIFLLPFGIALGVYGIWFTSSPEGLAYLANPRSFKTLSPGGNFQMAELEHRTPYGWN